MRICVPEKVNRHYDSEENAVSAAEKVTAVFGDDLRYVIASGKCKHPSKKIRYYPVFFLNSKLVHYAFDIASQGFQVVA